MRSGEWRYKAGTGSATVTIPAGAILTMVNVFGGTFTIYGGDTVTAPATGMNLRFLDEMVLSRTGKTDVVLSGTTSYFIEYFAPAGV